MRGGVCLCSASRVALSGAHRVLQAKSVGRAAFMGCPTGLRGLWWARTPGCRSRGNPGLWKSSLPGTGAARRDVRREGMGGDEVRPAVRHGGSGAKRGADLQVCTCRHTTALCYGATHFVRRFDRTLRVLPPVSECDIFRPLPRTSPMPSDLGRSCLERMLFFGGRVDNSFKVGPMLGTVTWGSRRCALATPGWERNLLQRLSAEARLCSAKPMSRSEARGSERRQ